MTDSETHLLGAIRDFLKVSSINTQEHRCTCAACDTERDRLRLLVAALMDYVEAQAFTITIYHKTTYRSSEGGGNDIS